MPPVTRSKTPGGRAARTLGLARRARERAHEESEADRVHALEEARTERRAARQAQVLAPAVATAPFEPDPGHDDINISAEEAKSDARKIKIFGSLETRAKFWRHASTGKFYYKAEVTARIKTLLIECEAARGKENKARVATEIMDYLIHNRRFVAQQYVFSQTVARKLLEFEHESFPGVREMSVRAARGIFGMSLSELRQWACRAPRAEPK